MQQLLRNDIRLFKQPWNLINKDPVYRLLFLKVYEPRIELSKWSISAVIIPRTSRFLFLPPCMPRPRARGLNSPSPVRAWSRPRQTNRAKPKRSALRSALKGPSSSENRSHANRGHNILRPLPPLPLVPLPAQLISTTPPLPPISFRLSSSTPPIAPSRILSMSLRRSTHSVSYLHSLVRPQNASLVLPEP